MKRSELGRIGRGRLLWKSFAAARPKRASRGALLVAAAILGGAVIGAQPVAVEARAPTPSIKPPAPPPSDYVSRADYARLKKVQDAVRAKNYAGARLAARQVSDPLARSLAEWMYFNARDPKVRAQDVGAFIAAHSDWPSVERLQAHAEERFTDATPAKEILAFFRTRDPVSGMGKYHYARALKSKGEADRAAALFREAWIEHDWLATKGARLEAQAGSALRGLDHEARVDRLIYAFRLTDAGRMLSKLTPDARRRAQVRINLLRRDPNAPAGYAALSEADRLDAGVLHAAVRYHRKMERESKAIALAMAAPDDPSFVRNAKSWWLERHLLARWALKNGRFTDAYAMAAGHGLVRGTEFAEAEFLAGWIALRFLGDANRAELHFAALSEGVSSPISKARGHYWRGRAAEAGFRAAEAAAQYRIASSYGFTYYGILAAEKQSGGATNKFAPPEEANAEERALFDARPTVLALKILSDLDNDSLVRRFAYHLDDRLTARGEFIALAELMRREGYPSVAVRVGKTAARRGIVIPDISYPQMAIPPKAESYADPGLVLGLSRQESEFNPRAYSRAGARGLMQLMPATAQLTARKEGMPYRRSWLMDDPSYNLTLGAAHLNHLLARYRGSYIMTLAAYNAGPHRVSRWVQEYGDPRDPTVDPIDWVELIPFSETRNYVQRVLENAQIYRARLKGGAIDGKLARDLTRGGKTGRAGVVNPPSATLFKIAKVNGPQELPSLPLRIASRGLSDTPSRPDMTPTAPAPRQRASKPKAKETPTVHRAPQPAVTPLEPMAPIRSQGDPAPDQGAEEETPSDRSAKPAASHSSARAQVKSDQMGAAIEEAVTAAAARDRGADALNAASLLNAGAAPIKAQPAVKAPAITPATPAPAPVSETPAIADDDYQGPSLEAVLESIEGRPPAEITAAPAPANALVAPAPEPAASNWSDALAEAQAAAMPPAAPEPEPKQVEILGPADRSSVKGARAKKLMDGAVETTDCEMFIPDSTGGGTCIIPK